MTQIWGIMKENLSALEEASPVPSERALRWELGSCWVQHLQKKETMGGESQAKSAENSDEAEEAVKGLGKQFKLLKKRDRKPTVNATDTEENGPKSKGVESVLAVQTVLDPENDAELKKLISKEAFLRLKETGTGLHLKVCISKQLVQLLL